MARKKRRTKKRTSRAGRTASGHIKKGYRLTRGGSVVKAKGRRKKKSSRRRKR